MSILSMDPGRKNFAWAFVERDNIEIGSLVLVKDSLDDLIIEARPQIIELLDRFKPDSVVAERFLSRGGAANFSNEAVNVLLGILVEGCSVRGIPCKLITSASWKNAFRRLTGMSANDIRMEGCSQHECDAVGIAAYAADIPLLTALLSAGGFQVYERRLKILANKIFREIKARQPNK